MKQLDLLRDLVALSTVVLTEHTCWYGQHSILGTVIALGWNGKHHCFWCCIDVEAA
jgi:hypothetical protein